MVKSYIKSIFTVALLFCSAVTFAQATSTVSADGDGSTLLINLNNPEYPFSAIQFDLALRP